MVYIFTRNMTLLEEVQESLAESEETGTALLLERIEEQFGSNDGTMDKY